MEPYKESIKAETSAKGHKYGHKSEAGGEKYIIIRHYVGDKPLIGLIKELTVSIADRQTEIK